MNRKELNALKSQISEKKEKASDLDVIVAEVMKRPYGQPKKGLTGEGLAVLARYGYTEG